MRILKVGDLVTGRFPDYNDLYPGGSPKHKTEVGIVTGVYIEEGYGTYRVSLMIRGIEVYAFDYSLKLLETT